MAYFFFNNWRLWRWMALGELTRLVGMNMIRIHCKNLSKINADTKYIVKKTFFLIQCHGLVEDLCVGIIITL